MPGNELHVISTGKQDWVELASIASRIWPYVTAIHIREKDKTAEEILQGIRRIAAAGVPCSRMYINGHPSLAEEALLGGIHLPGDSRPLPSVLAASPVSVGRTGFSVHSAEEALQREREGADYVMYGHIYATNSKPGASPRGLEQLREVAARTAVPVIAIGGITPQRVKAALAAGAAGVAVMSGILEAADPLQAVQTYAGELKREEER